MCAANSKMPHTSMCRPNEVAVSNPNHYMQTEERGTSGNDNEIEMESNPAYATCGVKCTSDQGEVIHCNGVHVHMDMECIRIWRHIYVEPK